MSRDELLSDLDYIKAMAEEGAHAPLVGGRIGLMWGLLIVGVFLVQWAILSRTLPLPESSLFILWVSFAVIGGLGCIILGRQADQKPGANSVANRVETHVWVMFAGMMFTLFIGVVLNQVFSGGTAQLFDLILVVGFAGQGLAYGVVARMSGLKWMHMASFASFVASAVCFTAYGNIYIYLIGAIGTFFTVVLPSLISLKQEPKHVI